MPPPRASSELPAPEPPRPGPMARWSGVIAGAGLMLAVVAVYWNSLGTPFHFDDDPAIVYNPTIRTLWPVWVALQPPAIGSGVTGRPVVNLSLAANYALGGLDPWGYHAVNMGLHALAGLVLWGVLRRTLRFVPEGRGHRTPPSGERRRDPVIPLYNNPEGLALGAALLWAVHPLLTESVICVVQRNEILGGLFYLLTLYGFIRSTHEPAGAAHRIWQGVSVIACLLGMASKEIVATAPLIVLLYDRTFVAGSFAAAWRQRKGYYLTLAATWLLLAGLMMGGEQRGGSVGFGLGMSSWDYLLTQCRALTIYLKLAVWPHPLVVDYGMEVSKLSEVWWRGLIMLGLLGATLWALVRRPAWGFVGAWFFVILAPSSSIVPLTTQTIAEHRMYLPLIAVLVAIGAGVRRWWQGGVLYATGLAAMVCGFITVQRNGDYTNASALWGDTVIRAPGNARAHLNFGQTLFKAGQLPEASAQFTEALRLRPDYAEAYYNQGLVMARLDRVPEAIVHFQAALRLTPDYAVAHNDLGIAYAEAGRMAEAQQEFEAAVRARADFPGAHFNLANLLFRTGRANAAIPHYEAALAINPEVMDYHNNLALACMQAGRKAEAIGHYAAAVRLAPAVPELRLHYALALAAAGRLREAVEQAGEAARLKPDFAAAQHYLAEMQADLQRLEAAKRQ